MVLWERENSSWKGPLEILTKKIKYDEMGKEQKPKNIEEKDFKFKSTFHNPHSVILIRASFLLGFVDAIS